MTPHTDFELPQGCRNPRVISPRGEPILVGCGQCRPCRRQRRQHWVGRQLLEASEHEWNQFLTLTYSPDEDEASYRDVQLWAKRLRKRYAGHRFSYITRGELGDTFGRFHWHVSLFNPPELLPTDERIHVPEWPHGHVFVRDFAPDTAAYVFGYTLKDNAWGETRYSARPGIGVQGLLDLADLLSGHQRFALAPPHFSVGSANYPLSYYAKTLMEDRMVENGLEPVPKDPRIMADIVSRFRELDRQGAYDRPRTFVKRSQNPRERRDLDGPTQQRLAALKPNKPRQPHQ